MHICPSCNIEYNLESHHCANCGWAHEDENGILKFISAEDAIDYKFIGYKDNYDAICKDDMESSIMPETYLNILVGVLRTLNITFVSMLINKVFTHASQLSIFFLQLFALLFIELCSFL